jgi:SAM-dependent methyltransferase
MNIQSDGFKRLMCVQCKGRLDSTFLTSDLITCPSCQQQYPVVNSIPILIDEKKSIFSFQDFLDERNLFFDISKKGKIVALISKLMPSMGGNNLGRRNFKHIEELLLQLESLEKPRVLVLGGSIIGEGMHEFVKSKNLEIVEGDVSFGPRTKIIFDAHSIPYEDESFDCVIVQAVLEHVIDPRLCLEEIKRVLKRGGFVYAETPFMQQVHGGPYDFTRYTRSGHRKLFQEFEEIRSGVTAGSGTAFAWAYEYFLQSLFGYNSTLRLAIKFIARITGFWIKYFDYLTKFNRYDNDGASGFYFLGVKSGARIEDRDLIKYYSLRD